MGDLLNRLVSKDQERDQPSAPDDDGFSLGNALRAIPGGLFNIGAGLGDLAYNAIKDAGSGFRWGVDNIVDTITPGDDQAEIAKRYNFATDDLAKALAFDWSTDEKPVNERILGLLQGIAEPYGFNPMKGDFVPDPGMAVQHLEEDPVGVAMDVWGAATLGGAALAKGAKVASAIPAVEADLAGMGRLARLGIDDAKSGAGWTPGRAATAVDRILPGVKYQKIGELERYGGTQRVLDQVGRVREFDMPTNPVRRVLKEARLKWRTTEAEEALTKKLAELDDQLVNAGTDTPVTNLRTLRDHTQATLNRARNARIERVMKDPMFKKYTSTLHKKLIAENGSAFITDRVNRRHDLLDPIKDLGPDDVQDLDLKLQAVPGYETQGPFVPFDDLRTLTANAPIEYEGLAAEIKPVVDLADKAASRVDDLDALHNSPIGERVYERFLGNLKANTDIEQRRLDNLRPGVGYRAVMTPEELAQLDERVLAAGRYEADAAKAFAEVVGEPAAGHVSELATAIDKVRLGNLRGETLGMLNGGYTFTELLDRLFEPQRVKLWHERGLGSLDEVEETGLDIYRQFREEGKKAPAYFPHYESLKHTRGKHLQVRKLRGMGIASDIDNLKKSSGSLMKEFYEETYDAYIRDPSEAYGRLAAEFANHESSLRLIDRIKHEAGLPMSALDEVPPGYVLMNPDGLKLLIRRDMDVRANGTRNLIDGFDPQRAWAQGVEDAFFSKRSLEDMKAHRGEVFAVPKVVAEELEAAARISLGHIQPHLRVWVDGPTNLWRVVNLYTRPGFYVNNVGGNTVFLKLQGAKLRNLTKQWDKRYQVAYNEMIADFSKASGMDVDAAVTGGLFETASFRTPHMGEALDLDGLTGATARGVEALQSSKAGRGASWGIKQLQHGNEVFENWARRESFMTALEKEAVQRGVKLVGNKAIRDMKRVEQLWKIGLDNPKLIHKALDGMNDTMNNYRALGPVERKIWRRFAQPFYPFYKHALKTMVKLPIEHPAKAQLLSAIGEMDEEFSGEEAGFLDDAHHAGPGRVPGTEGFFSMKSLNPFGGLSENPMTQIAPIPKMIVENALGQDLYSGAEFSSPNVVPGTYGGDTRYRMGPDGLPEETTVRPLFSEGLGGALNYIGNQFGPYKLARDLTTGGARYSTGELRTDEYGQPQYPDSNITQFLRYLGVPTYDINAQEYEARKQADQLSAQSNLLRLLRGQ